MAKEIKCPKCESSNIKTTKDNKTKMRNHVCENCGNSWVNEVDKRNSKIGSIIGWIVGFAIGFLIFALI